MALGNVPLLFAIIALLGRWPRPAVLLPVIVALLLAQPVWQVVRVSDAYTEWVGDSTSMNDMILREFALVVPAGVGWGLAAVSLRRRADAGPRRVRTVLLALGAGVLGTIAPFVVGLLTGAALVVAVLLVTGKPRSSTAPSALGDAPATAAGVSRSRPRASG